MRRESVSLVVLGGLLSLIVTATFAFGKLLSIDGRVAAAMTQHREHAMQTITETITTAEGRTLVIKTTRNDGESLAAWKARHNAAVAEMQGD